LKSESVRSLYDQLIVRLKDLTHLNGISGILQWDQEVMMPKKAARARAAQVRNCIDVPIFLRRDNRSGIVVNPNHFRYSLVYS
jgi:Zn-dependent M32 family carboxypeptidase